MLHDLPHWNYFRLLERDLEESFRYVSPLPEHFNVHSDYFARVIVMACVEIENCLRSFASKVANNNPQSIGQFQAVVAGQYPHFTSMKIDMPRFSLQSLEPWAGWTSGTAPDWWTHGYNKIKHGRIGHPDAPTLHRAISSVAALLVLLLHYYRLEHGHVQVSSMLAPTLLLPQEPENDGIYSGSVGWVWSLPGE
jgi:hypothetical protein